MFCGQTNDNKFARQIRFNIFGAYAIILSDKTTPYPGIKSSFQSYRTVTNSESLLREYYEILEDIEMLTPKDPSIHYQLSISLSITGTIYQPITINFTDMDTFVTFMKDKKLLTDIHLSSKPGYL